MIGDGDIDLIFESGDFDVEAVFDGTLTVRGWFTDKTEGVPVFSSLNVESIDPTFTAPTTKLETVRNKMSVTIDATQYQVEKVERVGTGVSVVSLKVKSA